MLGLQPLRERVDVLRVRGADNVRGAVRYFKLNDVDLVAFPPHFYVALGFDPVLAQAVPESSATPWGGHLAVRKGLLPFFVYFDLHPGSTLCGPNSRFWDAVRIYASLLAGANFERAIARRPPIDMCDSLFCLHNVDPAAAGRRARGFEAGGRAAHPGRVVVLSDGAAEASAFDSTTTHFR